MARTNRLSWLTIVLAALALVFAGTGTAFAHAKLASSVPAADSTVATAPATVVAVFENHDALVAEGSSLKVTDASGASVDMGDSSLDRNDPDRKTLVVSLKSGLPNGVYTVSWTAVSSGDGSTAEGTFTFTVSSGGTAASAPTSAPANLPRTGGEELPTGAIIGGALLVGLGFVARRRAAR